MRTAFLVVVTVLVEWGTALAQAAPTGSRDLPLDHWAYAYIGRLRDRGYLSDLNPLVQPYRRLDVARDLKDINPDTLREPVAGWVRLLKEEFAPELERLAGTDHREHGFVAMMGGRGSTSRRLDPARALGSGGVWPQYRVGAWLETGPVAAEMRLYGDTWYRADPDGLDPGYDPRDHEGGKADLAYLSVSLPFGSLEFGRMARNWASIGTSGLMVSDLPSPYTQIALDLRAGRLGLHAFTGELDTVLGQKRYFSAHELTYRGHGDFYLSLGESVVYASARGGPELRYLNPAQLYFFEVETPPADVTENLMLSAQAWARRGPLVLRGEFMLDDIDVNPDSGVPRAPARYGFDVGATWAPRSGPFTFSASYRQVASFTYRTFTVVDQATYLQRGLGDNFADYDRLTISGEFLPPVRGLSLAPTALVQRQGEGSIRASFPTDYLVFRRSPSLFLGVRETTYRVALRGRYQPVRQFWVRWDVGPNFVSNAGHMTGVHQTAFEAVGDIGVRLEFP